MLPALILVSVVTLYRICYALAGAPADWANFSPLAALLLCSAAYLPRKAVLLAALGPLVVADLIINAHYHAPFIDTGILPRYFCFGLILLLGIAIRKQRKFKLFLSDLFFTRLFLATQAITAKSRSRIRELGSPLIHRQT